jgi:hypothetical protein
MQPFDPRTILANVIGNSIKAEQAKRRKAQEDVATVVAAAAMVDQAKKSGFVPPGRAIQPAPSPSPVVTTLPNVGVGTAPPPRAMAPAAPPPAQDTLPIGGAGAVEPPTPPPTPSLGDNIGNILGPVKDNAASAVGYQAPANPLDNVGNVLAGPQDAIFFSKMGEDMVNAVNGNIPAGSENIPLKRKIYEWAGEHPDMVKTAHENGYTTDDGRVFEPGYRAVWEAYSHDVGLESGRKLNLGPQGNVALALAKKFVPGGKVVELVDDAVGLSPESLAAAGVNLLTDPYNALGGPSKKAGEKLGVMGAERIAEGAMGGGALGALGKIVGAPDAALDAGINEMKRGLGALAGTAGSQIRKNRVGQGVLNWFETSPRAQAENMRGQILRALGQEDQALANRPQIVDPNGISPPPAPPVAPVPTPVVETPGGWVVGDPAKITEKGSTLRRTVEDANGVKARIDEMTRRDGTVRYTTSIIGANGEPGKRRASETLDGAMALIDKGLGENPARITQQAPVALLEGQAGAEAQNAQGVVDALIGAEPVDQADPLYRWEPSPARSNRDDAHKRFFDRSRSHIAKAREANNPALEKRLFDAESRVNALRDEILGTTVDPVESLVPGADIGNQQFDDIQNKANRFEMWREEHLLDLEQRQMLEEAGIDPGPYVNNQPGLKKGATEGAWAQQLDELAWNPNEERAMQAADRLESYLDRLKRDNGEGNAAAFQLEDAIDTAIDNRNRFVQPEVADEVIEAAPDPYAHLQGMNDGDKSIFVTGLETPGPSQNKFVVANNRMKMIEERVKQAFDDPNVSEEDYQAALNIYQSAQVGARRLVEAEKRNIDYMNQAFARGEVTPAVQQAVQSGNGALNTAVQAADQSFTTAPIVAPEVADFLNTTFTNNQNQLGRTYGEVARELRAKSVDDKRSLVQLLTGATSQLDKKDLAQLNRLKKEYGVETLQDAVALNPEEVFQRALRDETYAEVGYNGPGMFRGLDTASRIFSSVNLLMPWKLPGYIAGNIMGDSWQTAMAFGPEATAAMNNIDHTRNMIQVARKGGDPLEGSIGALVKNAELGGYHPELVSDNLSEAIFKNESSAVNRAAGKSRLNIIGGIDKATGRMIDPARNLNNGIEWAHRTGLWGWSFEKRVTNIAPDYLREMNPLLQKYGIPDDEARAVFDALPPVVGGSRVSQTFGELALQYGVDAADAKGFAEEMGRKWQSKIHNADADAVKDVNKALFNFEQKNADVVARRIAPYTMWMSRAYPFYFEQMIRHPGFAAAYYQMAEKTKQDAQSEGWPPALQMMTRLAYGPAGMMMMGNPFAMAGMFDFAMEETGGYTPENVSAVQQVLNETGKYGFSLLPWWQAGLNLTGYSGDSPIGLDPIGAYGARKALGSTIKWAGTELGIGALAGAGKPFEQAMQDVRSFLSGHLPGSEWVPPVDASQAANGQIRQVMLDNELRDMGWTRDYYLTMVMAAEEDPTGPEAQAVDQLHGSILDEEYAGGADWMRAKKEVARADMVNVMVSAVVPGPKSSRQEGTLEYRGLAEQMWADEDGRPQIIPGVGPVPTDSQFAQIDTGEYGISFRSPGIANRLDPRDREFLAKWAERFGQEYRSGDVERLIKAASSVNQMQSLTPQAATLVTGQEQWNSIGTERERDMINTYYAIGFGESLVSIPSMNFTASAEQMAQLDDASRWDIAEAWMNENDPNGEVRNVLDLRDLYEESHPEYGAFATWKSDTRNQWGTAQAFRVEEVKNNPSFANFIEIETRKLRSKGKTPSEMQEELDRIAFSLDGYMAYNGVPKTRYSPTIKTGTHSIPLAQNGATGAGLGGEAGGGYGGSPVAWGDRVRTALIETKAAREQQFAEIGAYADEFSGDAYDSIQKMLSEDARLPEDSWIYFEYRKFYYAAEAAGQDTSIDAFIASTEAEQQADNLLPNGQSPVQYTPGVWPPQPVASGGVLAS